MGGHAFSTHLRNTNHLPSSRLFPGFMGYACPGGCSGRCGTECAYRCQGRGAPYLLQQYISRGSYAARKCRPACACGRRSAACTHPQQQRCAPRCGCAPHPPGRDGAPPFGSRYDRAPPSTPAERGAASAATRIAGHRCMVGFDDASRHGPRDQHRAIREPCSSGPSRWPRPP